MVELSRRKLFGAMGGAAVAGPAAIKSVLQSDPIAGMRLGSVGAGVAEYAKVNSLKGEDPNWLSNQLKSLLDERAAMEKDNRSSAERSGSPERWGIDGLRSVSASHRARMLEDAAWRRNRDQQLSWLDQRIASLRKDLGILGHLI